MKRFTISPQTDLASVLQECRAFQGEKGLFFQAGDYFLESSIALDSRDSGLWIQAQKGTRLIGAKKLTGWTIADDHRLDPAVRGKVYVVDLSQNGVTETGHLTSRGFDRDVVASHAELFLDGTPLNLSQYPKREHYLTITSFQQAMRNEWNENCGCLDAGFSFDDPRPAQWNNPSDLWVHGYWAWDWANSYEKVETLQNNTVKTLPPYGNYSFKMGQRFCFLNILEEVNTPGDYYIDRVHNLLYFYPESLLPNSELLLSMMEEPLFSLEGCKDITITGFSLEAVRGYALCMHNTEQITIDDCSFCNIGNYAVSFRGGKNTTVQNCTIHDCGDGGILMIAGDRKTLTHSGTVIHNNHIYRIAKWTRCYQPAIYLNGVGATVTNNLIHDCPHTAIMYWGNDMTIRDNEIYSVVLDTGDAGAIYTGRDYTIRGNAVCHNFIHHLGGVGMGTMGIYNDDCVSGTVMNDNYFLEVSRAVMLGGGRDFVVKNNVFVKCYPAISLDSRGADKNPVWRNSHFGTQRPRFYDIRHYDVETINIRMNPAEFPNDPAFKISGMDSPYIDRYPELAQIDRFYQDSDPWIPGSAVIAQNVFCAKPAFMYTYQDGRLYHDGKEIPAEENLLRSIQDPSRDFSYSISGGKGSYLIEDRYQATPADFADPDWGDISLRADSEASYYHCAPLPLSTIGLVESKRTQNPIRILSKLTTDGQSMTLSLRNTQAVPVAGNLRFYAVGAVSLSQDALSFSLEGKEERSWSVPLVQEGSYEVEMRSLTVGVRPARAQFIPLEN